MTKKYHFWITGCQMNYADARRVATELEKLGYQATSSVDDADVVVLETCTVRQQSEDKAYNKLHSLRPLKEKRSDLTVAVMGCVVGVRGNQALEEKFPFVDVFMEPSTDGSPLISHLQQEDDYILEQLSTSERHSLQDGEVILPADQRGSLGFCSCLHRLWLFTCLFLLHYSPAARHRALASDRRYRHRSSIAGCPRRKGSRSFGPDRRSLRL